MRVVKFCAERLRSADKTSSSVAEAMGCIEEWFPDILLTDINMPAKTVIR